MNGYQIVSESLFKKNKQIIMNPVLGKIQNNTAVINSNKLKISGNYTIDINLKEIPNNQATKNIQYFINKFSLYTKQAKQQLLKEMVPKKWSPEDQKYLLQGKQNIQKHIVQYIDVENTEATKFTYRIYVQLGVVAYITINNDKVISKLWGD